jgi:hypothetical protein
MIENLVATRKTNKMVNRVDQLAAVEQAVYEGEGAQVVLVKAPGGMGKSGRGPIRLSEEVQPD